VEDLVMPKKLLSLLYWLYEVAIAFLGRGLRGTPNDYHVVEKIY